MSLRHHNETTFSLAHVHPTSLLHRQSGHSNLLSRARNAGHAHEPEEEHWDEHGATHEEGAAEARAAELSILSPLDRNPPLQPSMLEVLPGAWSKGAETRSSSCDVQSDLVQRGLRAASVRCPTESELVARFHLEPHPEGGFFAETYRAAEKIACVRKPDGVHSEIAQRQASTGIYFLLTPGNVSRFHRIAADEMWHFYLGSPLTVVELDCSVPGHVRTTTLGPDVLGGMVVQHVVKAGTWFGSFTNVRLERHQRGLVTAAEGAPYSFVGCTVAPGFDFVDFELGSKRQLQREYPEAALEVLEMLCPGLP